MDEGQNIDGTQNVVEEDELDVESSEKSEEDGFELKHIAMIVGVLVVVCVLLYLVLKNYGVFK